MNWSNAFRQFWVGFRSRKNAEKIRKEYREKLWLVERVQDEKSKKVKPNIYKLKAEYYWSRIQEIFENIVFAVLYIAAGIVFLFTCLQIYLMLSNGIRVQVVP